MSVILECQVQEYRNEIRIQREALPHETSIWACFLSLALVVLQSPCLLLSSEPFLSYFPFCWVTTLGSPFYLVFLAWFKCLLIKEA